MGAPSTFDLDAVEASLVTVLAAALATAAPTCKVASIIRQDFGNDGELILKLPAARVRFNAAPFLQTVANSYSTTYRVLPQFDILCADQDLRGEANQAQASLVLARKVISSIAGVALPLPDGTSTEPLTILGVSRFLDDEAGMVYIVTVEPKGFAQFLPTGGGS